MAALKRGDKVIATARGRSISKLDDLKAQGADTLQLDVNASLQDIQEVAKQAVAIHGRVDVVVNNAGKPIIASCGRMVLRECMIGYVLVGAIEENTPEETLEQFKYVQSILRFLPV